MENILQKHKQDTAYTESFLILEQELATAVGLINEDIWVIKESLFNRLAAINPSLKSNKHLFTYNDSPFEILDPNHAIASILPNEFVSEIEYEINRELKREVACEFSSFIFGLSSWTIKNRKKSRNKSKTIGYMISDNFLTFFSTLNRNLGRKGLFSYSQTHQHIENKSINKRFDLLLNEYFSLTDNSNKPTYQLAEQYVEEQFKESLSKAFGKSMHLLSCSRFSHTQEIIGTKFNLANLYSVFLNIANMNQKELTQFLTGYYTDIPYFGKKTGPNIAITVYHHAQSILDDEIREIFIKSTNELIHIVYENSYNIHKFDKYNLKDSEKLVIAGLEINVNKSCLEDADFTVFEMLHYDNKNVVISNEFKYDEKAFRKIAMSYGKDNEFYEHLLDRKGLYYRWH